MRRLLLTMLFLCGAAQAQQPDFVVTLLGGAVRFELDGNIVTRGHNAADLLDWVATGRIELCYFSTSYLAGAVPEVSVLDLPFVVERRERAYAALNGALGERFSTQLATARGYKVLGYFDNGFRRPSNRLRPIRAPADCRGMRIRWTIR